MEFQEGAVLKEDAVDEVSDENSMKDDIDVALGQGECGKTIKRGMRIIVVMLETVINLDLGT